MATAQGACGSTVTSLPDASITPLTFSFDAAAASPDVPVITAPSKPGQSLPNIPVWNALSDPSLYQLPTLNDLPELNYTPPTINLPLRPTALVEKDLGQLPSVNYVDTPEYVATPLPTPPVIDQISLPTVPEYELPTFDEGMPSDDIVFTGVDFNYAELEFDAEVLAYVRTGLETNWTGISVANEKGLWQRARERQGSIVSAANRCASTLSSLFQRVCPEGATQSREAFVGERGELLNADMEAGIQLKQADLRLGQKKFAWTQGVEYEGNTLSFHESKMRRALASMKAQAKLGIDLFQVQAELVKARIGAYNIASEVYASRLRAAAQKLEIFKTKIEGAKMTAQMHKIYADIYQTQLEGVQTVADVYKTRMQAAQLEAEIQKMKLDVFKMAVDTFTSKVNAKSVEGRLFEAQVRGETAKAQIFRAQAEAYNAAVGAYKTKVEAGSVVTQAHIQLADLKLEKFRTELEEYRQKLNTATVRQDAQIDLYKVDIARFAAETSAESESKMANARIEKSYSDAVMKAANVYKDYTINVAKTHNEWGEIAMKERIACAEVVTKEAMAGVDMDTAKSMALNDIASRKTIATAESLTARYIGFNTVNASEIAAGWALSADWTSGINSIAMNTHSVLTGIYTAWDQNATQANIAIGEANAREAMAVATLTLRGNVAANA